MELNESIGMDVSENELRSSKSCSRRGWIRWAESEEERNPDSCCAGGKIR